MEKTITTTEAADRLGVKRETLYAYVSRGMLTSIRTPGSKESLFLHSEVELLATKSRPRVRSQAVNLTVDSAITYLDPRGAMYYRGENVSRLCLAGEFGQVAEFLRIGSWDGTSSRIHEAPQSPLSAGSRRAIETLLSPSATPVGAFRIALSVQSCADPLRNDRSGSGVTRTTHRIFQVALEAFRISRGANVATRRGTQKEESARFPLAYSLWESLTDSPATVAELKALNAALILLADHEMASSTLAARVAASTWADPYLVVSAGLAALSGPLHGSMSDRVASMIANAAANGADVAIGEALSADGHLAGFGHMVYLESDPRFDALWPLVVKAWGKAHSLKAARQVVEHQRGKFPNIDFALGSLVSASGLGQGAGEAIFAFARTAGWIAHAVEEYQHRLRFRTRCAYTGPEPELS